MVNNWLTLNHLPSQFWQMQIIVVKNKQAKGKRSLGLQRGRQDRDREEESSPEIYGSLLWSSHWVTEGETTWIIHERTRHWCVCMCVWERHVGDSNRWNIHLCLSHTFRPPHLQGKRQAIHNSHPTWEYCSGVEWRPGTWPLISRLNQYCLIRVSRYLTISV